MADIVSVVNGFNISADQLDRLEGEIKSQVKATNKEDAATLILVMKLITMVRELRAEVEALKKRL